MKDTIVYYHKNCLDGFGAAYAAWLSLGDTAVYIPIQYGEDIWEESRKHICPGYTSESGEGECDDVFNGFSKAYFVDFSIDPIELVNLSPWFDQIVIIDHHETAVRKLQATDEWALECEDEGCTVAAVLDMSRSGAMMTWDYFWNDTTDAPIELLMIQDRDLWKFEYPETKAFTEAMYMQKFDFDVWDNLLCLSMYLKDYTAYTELRSTGNLIEIGNALLAKQEKVVSILEKKAAIRNIEGNLVPCVDATFCFASDLGNNLSKEHPFAAIITVNLQDNELMFSLRSSATNPNHVNVAKLAEKFGGGGHKHAAGFTVKLDNVNTQYWLGRLSSLRSTAHNAS